MKQLASLIVALSVTSPAILAAQASTVRGVVFVDANANGKRDAGERGLAGAVVSNQDAVVVTDASGAFQISHSTSGIIFVSVPNGYRAVGPFWHSDSTGTADFALATAAPAADFSFIHASDTHIAPASLNRTVRLRALTDSIKPGFLLIAGDLVRDALRVGEPEARGYYDLLAGEFAKFKTPIWTVPGNHENFGIERNLSKVSATHPLYGRAMYHSYFGPDYYSFTYGGVHFVGLNTVDIDDMSYYGHVDSLQLAWLERDLEHVPADMPVVTFDHIPLATSFIGLDEYTDSPPAPTLITVKGKTSFRHTVSNAGQVIMLLRKHRYVLGLGAHLHSGERLLLMTDGIRTRFEQSAAVVGPSQQAGIPFPSGITLYKVHNGVIDAGTFIPLDPRAAKP